MVSKNVILQGNTIVIRKLEGRSIGEFYACLRTLFSSQENSEIELEISPGNPIYPNWILPVVGVLEYYKNKGISFKFKDLDSRYVDVVNPRTYSDKEKILDRIWKFSDGKDVSAIVDGYRCEFEKHEVFGKGVLQAMEWALYEVMDNVIQHSNVSCGYVMAQYHQKNQMIALAVFDYGQGILQSFSGSEHASSALNDLAAIELAVREGITRDKKVGQGNGLFGLVSIVTEGRGSLCISSGEGVYSVKSKNKGAARAVKNNTGQYPCKEARSTLVDFQIGGKNEIDLSRTEFFTKYPLPDYYIEDFENSQSEYVYEIAKHSEGTGTRVAGMRARNQILNIIKAASSPITLDFTHVDTLSSSYADELLVKLLLELGLLRFNQAIRLKGLSELNQRILERSFRQRVGLLQYVEEEDLLKSRKGWVHNLKGWLERYIMRKKEGTH
ncbi:STAS-like domain-containing protein [Porphyromonas sp.]